MTRVLHVLDHSLPLHSGYTFRTRAILKAQQASGLDVRGITGVRHTAEGPDTEAIDGLVFHRTPGEAAGPAGLREWREIGRLADAIEGLAAQWRPDILHAHSPALGGAAALRAGRRLGVPVVYEIRAFWEDAAVGNLTGREGSLKYRLTRRLESHVVAEAGAVVTICDGLRQDLIARGNDPARITVMPNGVDLQVFGTPLSRDGALAAELGLGEGPVIGFIGSFYDYEGIDDLIAAMPALTARHADARLLLVGGGPRETVLKAQAQASPAAAAIRFVGRVPHDQVERYYALADIMAYPRKRSRLTDLVTPLKPLEAMAQGKLVAASDVGGHRELIEHGVTGTLFAPDDPSACAEALAGLLAQRGLWDGYRAAGRRHVESRHDWARNVERYRDVYRKLLSGKRERLLGAAARRRRQEMNEVSEVADPIRKKPRGRRPITRHPLFPAMVALWTGALLALAGLALVPGLAAPTRIAVALAMAAVGGAIGMVAARRFAAAPALAAGAPAAEPDADPLWSDLKARRRELGDTEPDTALGDAGPALDREPEILEVANVAMPGYAGEIAPAPRSAMPTAAERIAKADLNDLSYVELLERLALSMQRRGSQRRGLDSAPLAAALERHLPPPPRREPEPAADPANSPSDISGRRQAWPHQADSVETEQALRDALAALQRMSGAA